MSLFSRPKTIIWPKAQSTEIFLDKKENNFFSSEINLWQDLSEADQQSLSFYIKQNGIKECAVLIPDDIVVTKSFIYDSKITTIDVKEVVGLAESFVHFRVFDDSIDYNLVPAGEKTIIQARIFQKDKYDILKANLSKLGLVILETVPVSASITKIFSAVCPAEYFLFYPHGTAEVTLILAKGDSVFLSTNLKKNALDIQKLINYSKLYFNSIITKIFVPENSDLDIIATSKLEKTTFADDKIAQNMSKAPNLPLPVLGLIIKSQKDIHSPSKKMENKRNILPFIAVFVLTAAIASIAIWFVINRNSQDELSTPASELPTPTIAEVIPTDTPAPTLVEVKKTLKLQVLNATDINGQAATLKSELVKLGFTDVATGNSKEEVTGNEIRLKPSLATSSAYFESKLSAVFPATFSNTLKETSTYDVVFIIGAKLGSASPAATPTTTTEE